MSKKQLYIFGAILFIGAFLRLFHLTGFSLSNDELSALGRLEFANVYEVIEKGVRPDFHPAGVQLFLYYWTMLFGNGEFMVRLPFAILGITSIVLLFLLSRMWFNTNTALYTTLAFSVLQYPVLYSQIARPYSPGVFFVLAFALAWSVLMFREQKYANDNRKLYGLFSAVILTALGCLYTHYFAGLLCLIIYLSGVFFLRRTTWFTYLILGLLIIIGFLPHATIFFDQMKIGGVGGEEGWLPVPERGYLGKYLFYAFNGSDIIYLISFGLFIGSFVIFRKTLELTKFHALAIVWFVLLYFIGYHYSILRNPVLQYSILLFAFPFLLMFMFSFIPNAIFNKKNVIILSAFALLLLLSTTIEKKYYSKQHFGEFRKLAEKTIEYSNKFGSDNIARAINIHSPFYIDYYLRELDNPLDFKIYKTNEQEHMQALANIVEESKEPHFLQAWSTINNPSVIEQIITSKYPIVVQRDTFFNSGLVLYSKSNDFFVEMSEPLYSVEYDYEGEKDLKGDYLISDSVFYKGSKAVFMDSINEFGPTFIKSWKEISKEKDVFVQSEIWAMVNDTSGLDANLVFSIESNSKSVLWRSTKFKTFISEPGKWTRVFLSYPLPNTLKGNEEVKLYIWKPGIHQLHIDDFKVSFTQR